jgi:hypothetical protein
MSSNASIRRFCESYGINASNNNCNSSMTTSTSMNKKYVAENLDDLLSSESAGNEVRYVGDAGRDPYINARTIARVYITGSAESYCRVIFLQDLGLLAGDIEWDMGKGVLNWRGLIKWALPKNNLLPRRK